MKTAELIGEDLDYWVAKAEGIAEVEIIGGRCEAVLPGEDGEEYWTEYRPSLSWATAGPIIEREGIGLKSPSCIGDWGVWAAWERGAVDGETGPTPLVAAMRAYVASKYGEEVPEIPR